jgi:hypothetical protein
MVIALLDVYTWAIVCLTPHVAVATSSAAQVMLHFTTGRQTASGFATTLFWMVDESNLLYSIAFFAGLVYWLRHPDRAMLALYVTILGTLLTLTVLIVPVCTRYTSALYPLMSSAAIVSADALLREWSARFSSTIANGDLWVGRRWRGLMILILLAGFCGNLQLNKVFESYDRRRILDQHAALEYIARHKRPGDKVMSVRPPAGAIVLGGIDYYALVAVHYDEIYMQKHGLTDRWSGGKLVWKLDQYQKIFQEHDRVWIAMDEKRLRSMPSSIAAYLLQSCSVEYEFFGGQVLLWDRTAGRYQSFTSQGGDDDSF